MNRAAPSKGLAEEWREFLRDRSSGRPMTPTDIARASDVFYCGALAAATLLSGGVPLEKIMAELGDYARKRSGELNRSCEKPQQIDDQAPQGRVEP